MCLNHLRRNSNESGASYAVLHSLGPSLCWLGCTSYVESAIPPARHANSVSVVVAAVKDNRSDLIAQYNSAVDSWNSIHKADFQRAAVVGFQFYSANTIPYYGKTYVNSGGYQTSYTVSDIFLLFLLKLLSRTTS